MWRTIGHDKVIALLENELKKGLLSRAFLLIGPKHVGKTTISYDLALTINCSHSNAPCLNCSTCQRILNGLHPDIFYIGIDSDSDDNKDAKIKSEIGIKEIRQLQQNANLPPFEGKYKVFIVNGADQLSNEAANCLLKTLEEPADKIIIILLAEDETKILPTITSRCQRIYMKPIPTKLIEEILIRDCLLEPTKAKTISRLSNGCPGIALNYSRNDTDFDTRINIMNELENLISLDISERFSWIDRLENNRRAFDRKKMEILLVYWLSWWRDLLLIKNDCANNIINMDYSITLEKWSDVFDIVLIKDFIENLQYSLSLISKNANIRLILEVIMLDMPYIGKKQ